MKQQWVCALALSVLGTTVSFAQDTTTVNWGNFSSTSTTQNAILFRDAGGTALSQGVATTNTDGMLVQLGYFNAATTANNFGDGTWVPLTGFTFSSLPTQPARTSIGDSFNNTGSGNGVIDFQTFFLPGENQPYVYDPSFSGAYQTQSSITITNSLPQTGQVLSIRFYDATTNAGHYNTVSADNWTWQSPNTAGGGQVNISIATLYADGPGGSLPDLEWQSVSVFGLNGTEFRTVLPIPEPSSLALFGIGLVAIPLLRRRKA
jgi:hypothetical protein